MQVLSGRCLPRFQAVVSFAVEANDSFGAVAPEERVFRNDFAARIRAAKPSTNVVVVTIERPKLFLVLGGDEILIVTAEAERVIAADAVLSGIDELHRAIHVLQDSVMCNSCARALIQHDALLYLINSLPDTF